ncbi:MAG TPA: hypothetical protein VJR92_09370 [Gemmatimonadaceae bacterium]|nr:hypothetical protein [Gemmatimonadaceae bacterium]
MEQGDLKFEWYDAWILAAVAWSAEGDAPIPLWKLIWTADALNKAIVTRGELECGIGRLVRAGFVEVAPEGFKAMPKALALVAPGPPMEIVSKAIGAQEWSSQAEFPRALGATYVTAEAYDKALKKYHKEFWKRYHQPKQDNA